MCHLTNIYFGFGFGYLGRLYLATLTEMLDILAEMEDRQYKEARFFGPPKISAVVDSKDRGQNILVFSCFA